MTSYFSGWLTPFCPKGVGARSSRNNIFSQFYKPSSCCHQMAKSNITLTAMEWDSTVMSQHCKKNELWNKLEVTHFSSLMLWPCLLFLCFQNEDTFLQPFFCKKSFKARKVGVNWHSLGKPLYTVFKNGAKLVSRLVVSLHVKFWLPNFFVDLIFYLIFEKWDFSWGILHYCVWGIFVKTLPFFI